MGWVSKSEVFETGEIQTDLPRVVFFSAKPLKKVKPDSGLFESELLPIDCHCPLLSMSDTKPAVLPLRLPAASEATEKASEARRETGEGYSTGAPVGG